jgi:hypothetical protein
VKTPVHLHELPEMRTAQAAAVVPLRFPEPRPESLRQHPAAQRGHRNVHIEFLREMLGGERRAEPLPAAADGASEVFTDQCDHFAMQRRRMRPIRPPPHVAVHQPLLPASLKLTHETLDLAIAHPQHRGRFMARQLAIANPTHHNPSLHFPGTHRRPLHAASS